MGQKINPIGLRVGIQKRWRSRWYSPKKGFPSLVLEDIKIRELLKKRLENAAVADLVIERYANRARINVYTARPGMVIGRKGADIDRIRAELSNLTGKEIYIEPREVKNPETNAHLIAENIALQISRRVAVRRAIKHAISVAMGMGVLGIKIRASGRLGGAELARTEWHKEGKIPLHTLSSHIEYGFAEAATTAGRIGIKVWVCKNKADEAASNGGR